MYNKCLSDGFVPDEWKVAHVVPIFKKGDPQSPANYRPISLTSVLCKVLERVVRNQMLSYLSDHNILPDNQHGFVSNKSTVSNLIHCLDDWTRNVDNAVQTDVIYLDYSKCFDSVVHSKLLYKLQRYGFTEDAFLWIQNFLLGRKQHVKVGNSLSAPKQVISGVPQGTVLGPLLFLLFSADINNVIQHSSLSMYADDTKVYRANVDWNDCTLLQADLNCISEWASDWQLRLNPVKTKHLRIGYCKCDYRFLMSGMTIDTVEYVRDIGIIIQSSLKFSLHCSSVVQKAHYCIRNIFHTFKGHGAEFYTSLYKTYVRPLLESSSPVWSPYLLCNVERVESVQRYFTRRIPGCANLSYSVRLETLGLETLENRRIKFDLILYYKVLHGCIVINVSKSIRAHESHRGHKSHLYHFYSRTNARKFFWSNRLVKHWNALDSNIINCQSVYTFRKSLKDVKFEGRGSIN